MCLRFPKSTLKTKFIFVGHSCWKKIHLFCDFSNLFQLNHSKLASFHFCRQFICKTLCCYPCVPWVGQQKKEVLDTGKATHTLSSFLSYDCMISLQRICLAYGHQYTMLGMVTQHFHCLPKVLHVPCTINDGKNGDHGNTAGFRSGDRVDSICTFCCKYPRRKLHTLFLMERSYSRSLEWS